MMSVRERTDKMKRYPILIVLLAGLLSVLACRQSPEAEGRRDGRLDEFRAFCLSALDSLTADPQWVRAQALRQMRAEDDSLVWYHYAGVVMKSYFFTFDLDSVRRYYERGLRYFREREDDPVVEDLASEYSNTMGNLYARLGSLDSAALCFEEAYRQRLRGVNMEAAPDILMNLADVRSRLGRYDLGAYWYRRALLLSDSLQLTAPKTPIYYGLGQIYMALRDFDLCDYYFNLAGESFSSMLPYEQYIYLNNRGNSYYYREDYPQAMSYFRRSLDLVERHRDLAFERNLCYLNMSDVFLKMGQTDSCEVYLKRCRPFFEQAHSVQALYYVDTQDIGLALSRHDLASVREILARSVTPPGMEPDILLIRNTYLQRYYEAIGDYRQAYRYQQTGQHMADSVRGERVRMRVATAYLRYAQDSTLMAQNMLIQKKENELLEMRQTRWFWVTALVTLLLVLLVLYMYNKKKAALLLARNRRAVSSLRLENIRNRLSPHFIFNVLNQEMAGRKEEEKHELASLVKLMRRNLELAEQLCVTLAEELDFVRTYIDLERRSLGSDFRPEIRLGADVHPEQVLIPSMLIQIPVENAVKHALRDKEGDRRLWIVAERVTAGISLKVTDNGGGYRPDSRNRGTGTGMKVIMQTIQILNQKNRAAIEVSVHNVTLPGGETGCEVGFLLPERYDYTL